LTPAERAKRDAENVFRWITIHNDKPRKVAPPPKDDKSVVVVRAKPPARAPGRADDAASAPPPTLAANLPAQKQNAATSPAVAATPSAAAPAADTMAQRSALAAAPGGASTTSAPPVAAAEEEVSDALTPLSQAEPKFPINLVRTLRTGQVQVRFTVLPDGSVAEPAVVSSSNPRLNPSALAAVAQWRFAPVRKPQQGVVDLGFTSPE
jgi:TonB family protein